MQKMMKTFYLIMETDREEACINIYPIIIVLNFWQYMKPVL